MNVVIYLRVATTEQISHGKANGIATAKVH